MLFVTHPLDLRVCTSTPLIEGGMGCQEEELEIFQTQKPKLKILLSWRCWVHKLASKLRKLLLRDYVRNTFVSEGVSQKYCRTNGRRSPVQIGGVLQYKWEVYCGACLSPRIRSQKAQRYKWVAYCSTTWRCTAVLFRQAVRVGGRKQIRRTICPFGIWCPTLS